MRLEATLRDRAARGGVALPDGLVEPLLVYYQLLRRWNEKINLTGLGDTDEAIDRLLLEPIAAAHVILKHPTLRTQHSAPSTEYRTLIDLGSGGGSPAVPLGLALRPERLVMVESRGRKAAFLREVARAVPISGIVEVLSQRFEALTQQESFHEAADLVSVRAVRVEASTLSAAAALLRRRGHLVLFRGPEGPDFPDESPAELVHAATEPLLRTSNSRVTLLRRA